MFKDFGFSLEDINILYTAFCRIDANNSGTITAGELLEYFRMNDNYFSRFIFTMFDEDQSGLINFLEFVVSVWNFLTANTKHLGAIMYYLREPSGKLHITHPDCKTILETIHQGKTENIKNLTLGLAELRRLYDTFLSIEDVSNFVMLRPYIVTPLFVFQTKLRKILIGKLERS